MALSLSDLTTRCSSFQLGYYRYYPELREYFKLLELSGCRTTEPLDVSRWSYVDSSTLLLQPLKGNNQRVISVGSSCPNFVEDVRLRRKPFKGRTLANVYSAFDDIRNFRNLKSQSKPISVYIFRYRFIKSLYASGMNVQQVANTMGYTSTETPQYYLQAELVEDDIDLPTQWLKVGNQIISNRFLAVDDGGVGIIANPEADPHVFGLFYSRIAVDRLIPSFNGCHIITPDDYFNFRAFCVSQIGIPSQPCNPSPQRFLVGTNLIYNPSGLKINGNGRNDGNGFFFTLQMATFWNSLTAFRARYLYRVTPSPSNWQSVSSRDGYAAIWLFLNDPILV